MSIVIVAIVGYIIIALIAMFMLSLYDGPEPIAFVWPILILFVIFVLPFIGVSEWGRKVRERRLQRERELKEVDRLLEER